MILLLGCLMSSVNAEKLESAVSKARKATGNVITCVPYNKDGLHIDEAIKKLRTGSILRVTPGYYYSKETLNKRVNIPKRVSNIIIEGDGSSGFCDLEINFEGKNCIVRNIWLNSIECYDGTIVDSTIVNLILVNGGKKVEQFVDNCCLNCVSLYADRAKMFFKNCTLLRVLTPKPDQEGQWRYNAIRHSYGGMINLGALEHKGEITFTDCVFYTNQYLFRTHWKTDPLKIFFDNCMIYGEQGSWFNGKEVANLDGCKDYLKLRTKGDLTDQKASFVKKPNYAWHRSGRDFELANNCPGKKANLGANIGPRGIPVKR
jgi:hypothetical protein